MLCCVFFITHVRKCSSLSAVIVRSTSFRQPGKQLKVNRILRHSYLLFCFCCSYDLRRKLLGAKIRRKHTVGAISPDGQFCMAGSEDGKAYIWELRTGRIAVCANYFAFVGSAGCLKCILSALLQSVLTPGYPIATSSCAWHPTQHMVAVTAFGADCALTTFDAMDPARLARLETAQRGSLH